MPQINHCIENLPSVSVRGKYNFLQLLQVTAIKFLHCSWLKVGLQIANYHVCTRSSGVFLLIDIEGETPVCELQVTSCGSRQVPQIYLEIAQAILDKSHTCVSGQDVVLVFTTWHLC